MTSLFQPVTPARLACIHRAALAYAIDHAGERATEAEVPAMAAQLTHEVLVSAEQRRRDRMSVILMTD